MASTVHETEISVGEYREKAFAVYKLSITAKFVVHIHIYRVIFFAVYVFQ